MWDWDSPFALPDRTSEEVDFAVMLSLFRALYLVGVAASSSVSSLAATGAGGLFDCQGANLH